MGTMNVKAHEAKKTHIMGISKNPYTNREKHGIIKT